MNNKEELYNITSKGNKYLYILVVIAVIIVFCYSYNHYSYDKKELIGLHEIDNNSSLIKITLESDELEMMDQNPIIEYDNKTYKIEKVLYEEPYLNNGVAVNDITIKTNKITESKTIKFTLKYNKQRIISKIKKLVERK